MSFPALKTKLMNIIPEVKTPTQRLYQLYYWGSGTKWTLELKGDNMVSLTSSVSVEGLHTCSVSLTRLSFVRILQIYGLEVEADFQGVSLGAGWCRPLSYRYLGPATPRPGRTWWRRSHPGSSACWPVGEQTVAMKDQSVGQQTNRSSEAFSPLGETWSLIYLAVLCGIKFRLFHH